MDSPFYSTLRYRWIKKHYIFLEIVNIMPRISVIIPCYNYSPLVGRAIESVLNQTYHDFEVIVIDDGSTDNSAEVILKFSQIRYFYQKNKGPNAARNTGIQAATGEFIALLDADDEWLPDKLERQIVIMETRPEVGLVFSNVFLVEGLSGAIIGTYPRHFFHEGHVIKKLFMNQFIPSPTPLIRRSVFEQVGLFNPNTIGSDDWEMWLRISAKFNFACIYEPLAKYTLHSSWGSRTTYIKYERENLAFFALARRDYPEEITPFFYKLKLSTFMEQLGWYLIKCDNRAEGVKRLRLAIKYNPFRFKNYFLLFIAYLGPRFTSERCRLGRVKYLQGKHSLYNCQYSCALKEFYQSILSDPISNPKAYVGIVITTIGRPLIKHLKTLFPFNYEDMGAKPDDKATFQQW